MRRTILRRLAGFVVTMLLLSMAVFVMARLAPGDPLQSFYGDAAEQMTAAEMDAARARLGLDAPLPVQYVKWLSGALQGEFGLSLRYKMPVAQVAAPLLGNTLLLGGAAYGLVFLLATLLAVVCVRYEDTAFDRWVCRIGTAMYNLPPFWVGVLLVLVFSVNWKWLPSSGAYDVGKAGDVWNRIQHMILPLTVMVLSHLWYYAYLIRNRLVDEVRQDYVLNAKAQGYSKTQILLRQCLRNVAPSIVSLMAISVPHLLSGTYIVESVFHYPGVGALSVESAKYHDYNLLMLLVMLTGAAVVLSSLLARTINEHMDARLRDTEGAAWQN